MVRCCLAILLALLVSSCAVEPDRTGSAAPSATATGASTSPETPPPSDPSTVSPEPGSPKVERNVEITRPREGETITTNPVTIEGRARTFENNVEIRLDDEHGQQIVATHTTARGEMGQFSPYSTEVLLTSDPGKTMTITAIERSAEDGSIRTSHAVTVRVAGRKAALRLYFPNSNRGGTDCTVVEAVVRDVPASLSAARMALEALLRGPSQPEAVAGFTNPFPRGAALRSVNLANGVLRADFNEAMENVGGSCRVQAIRGRQYGVMNAFGVEA